MSAYNISKSVTGEFATSEGLVQFEYKAGAVTPDGDEAILNMLVDAGVATLSEEAPKTTKTKTEPAPAVEEVTEEN